MKDPYIYHYGTWIIVWSPQSELQAQMASVFYFDQTFKREIIPMLYKPFQDIGIKISQLILWGWYKADTRLFKGHHKGRKILGQSCLEMETNIFSTNFEQMNSNSMQKWQNTMTYTSLPQEYEIQEPFRGLKRRLSG